MQKTQPVAIILNCSDHATATEIGHALSSDGGQPRITQRQNLGGEPAAWIVAATLGLQALPHLISAIEKFVLLNKVQKLKIGGTEVEFSSGADLATVRAIIAAQATNAIKDPAP